MRPEILFLPLAILLTIVSTFSPSLSLSISLSFDTNSLSFLSYIHSTQRSYHLKPNLDPKARREEIPAGISPVSPPSRHGFSFLVHFPCCIRNWNLLEGD